MYVLGCLHKRLSIMKVCLWLCIYLCLPVLILISDQWLKLSIYVRVNMSHYRDPPKRRGARKKARRKPSHFIGSVPQIERVHRPLAGNYFKTKDRIVADVTKEAVTVAASRNRCSCYSKRCNWIHPWPISSCALIGCSRRSCCWGRR